MEGKSYCCGKPGHKSPTCREKDKPKEEWAINKAQQSHAQAAASKTKITTQNSTTTPRGQDSVDQPNTGWAGAHWVMSFHSQRMKDEMKDWILLDSESTDSIFCNPKYVTNIQTITREEGPIELMTNGGSLTSNQKADVPKFGTVWFNPHAITNIFSTAEMASRYKITYDSSKERASLVHVDGKPVRFEETASGLYVCKPRNNAGITMVTTIKENKTFYTPRQFDQAKKARNLYHAIGTPSIPEFKSVLRMNLIKNCPITTKDIDIAEKSLDKTSQLSKEKQHVPHQYLLWTIKSKSLQSWLQHKRMWYYALTWSK